MRNPGRPLPDCAASPLHPDYGADNDKHMIEKPSAAHALPLAEGEGELAGRLAQNIVYFARALRAAGIPVGPKTIIDALDALKAAGVGTREDFYWTLHAVFVKRHEHSILFDQAFRLFFRKRAYLERLMAMMMSQVPAPATEAPKPASQRVQEALFAGLDEKRVRENQEIEVDARLTMSASEILQKKDFAQMTATRIAASLHSFNKKWARRVLTQGAIVLLITDGLERDPDDVLAFEIDRLHRSCRRLIWLNPLLRFDRFEAKAKGIRVMLPYVDEFRPIHNLEAIADLCRALSADAVRPVPPRRWLQQVA